VEQIVLQRPDCIPRHHAEDAVDTGCQVSELAQVALKIGDLLLPGAGPWAEHEARLPV
jgi:hypothetical protein